MWDDCVDLDVKKTLLIILFLLVGCSTSQKEYDYDQIINREYVYYNKFSDEIVDGEVYKMFDDKKVPLGMIKNWKSLG